MRQQDWNRTSGVQTFSSRPQFPCSQMGTAFKLPQISRQKNTGQNTRALGARRHQSELLGYVSLGDAEHDPEPSFWTALKLLCQPNSAPLWSLHNALHPLSLSAAWDVLRGSAVSQAVPEITMHNCRLLRFRKMQRQPLDESLHGRDNMSFHSSILLCPGLNLLLNVISCKKGTKALRERDRHKEASSQTAKQISVQQPEVSSKSFIVISRGLIHS